MKQKIVVKVHMNCEKCRTKARKIAASSNGKLVVDYGRDVGCSVLAFPSMWGMPRGVEEMRIEGQEKDKVVVIGEGVDSIRLVKCLRKKFGYAELLSVNEVKPTTSKQQEQQKKEKSTSNPTSSNSADQGFQYPHRYPQLVGCYDLQVYDLPAPSSCSLM